jgi:hypothetical protein
VAGKAHRELTQQRTRFRLLWPRQRLGEVAAKLYELMSRHGINKDLSDLSGADHVIASDGLVTCSKEPSGPRCFFAYDVPNNKATGIRVCE